MRPGRTRALWRAGLAGGIGLLHIAIGLAFWHPPPLTGAPAHGGTGAATTLVLLHMAQPAAAPAMPRANLGAPTTRPRAAPGTAAPKTSRAVQTALVPTATVQTAPVLAPVPAPVPAPTPIPVAPSMQPDPPDRAPLPSAMTPPVLVRGAPPSDPAHMESAAAEPPADDPPTRTAAAAPAGAGTPAEQAAALVANHRDCGSAPHPAALRERGIEGAVTLRVKVGSDGRAADVHVLASSGWRLFDEAALQQVRGCRFQPARRAGQPVDSWVEFPVRFALSG